MKLIENLNVFFYSVTLPPRIVCGTIKLKKNALSFSLQFCNSFFVVIKFISYTFSSSFFRLLYNFYQRPDCIWRFIHRMNCCTAPGHLYIFKDFFSHLIFCYYGFLFSCAPSTHKYGINNVNTFSSFIFRYDIMVRDRTLITNYLNLFPSRFLR